MEQLCLRDLQHHFDLQIKKQEALMDAMDGLTDRVNGLHDVIRGNFVDVIRALRGLQDVIRGNQDSIRGNQENIRGILDNMRRLVDVIRDVKDKVKDLEDDDKYVPSSSEEENEEDFEGLVSEEDVSVESQPDKRGFKQIKERSAPEGKLPRTFMQKISSAVTKNQKTKGR